ncbi:methyl-accepting chemotaxis protein [Nitrincola sp. MINF-07-Sa-05]|uniref:methyl-accepting chemotaxis protein n=1 Tax=Nitrincola salilacus TaxID=3400273 RepID=UPI003917E018
MKNLTVRKLFLFLSLIVSSLMILLALATVRQLGLGQELAETSNNRYQSYLLADELRQSSDELTRLARTYAITGDPAWEKQYFEILAIRNGEKPRPQNYHRIYWDFVAAGQPAPQPPGDTVALTALMRQAGFTEAELAKLTEAQRNSDALVALETRAMNAVKGQFEDQNGAYTLRGEPDLALARSLMHSADYHQFKAQIMKPVDEFFELLDHRTQSAVSEANHQATQWLSVLIGIVLAILAVLLSGLYFSYRFLKRTIGGEPVIVARALQEIAEGNIANVLPRASHGSIMSSAEAMRTSLVHVISATRKAAESITDSAADLHRNSEQTSERVNLQQKEAEQVAAAMTEMVATVQDVALSVSRVAELSQQTDAHARDGLGIMTESADAITTLASEIEEVARVIEHVRADSQAIFQVVDVINSIADQTNLLALNAAIEAARAGEQGRGFAVVADEVRTLASRTQGSTNEINSMIEKLQNSAVQAVNAMTEGCERARRNVQLSSSASTAFKTISTSVNELNDMNVMSATAAEQQEAVAEQINLNLNNISQSVTETATSARHLAKSAASLTSLTEEMMVSISHFQLPQQG